MRHSYRWLHIALFSLFVTAVYGQSATDAITISENSRYQEDHPVLSADDQTLYFSRHKHPRNLGTANAADIWIRNRMPDGNWGRPLNAGSPINSAAADVVLGISSDGRQLAILRKGAVSYLDVLVQGDRSWQISGTWPLPEFTSAAFDLEARKLVFTQLANDQTTDLFTQYAQPNGEWTPAVPLLLNTPVHESQPYLAADGQSLYFKRAGQWMVSRFDPTTGDFGQAVSLSKEIPGNWREIAISVAHPEKVIVTTTTALSSGQLVEHPLPVAARPIASRLLTGKITVSQSPTDRINGTSIRLLVGGRERQVYPNREGEYTIVVPADQTANIMAEAPGYFSPGRLVNTKPETDLSLVTNETARTYSDAYYQRETQLREIHRSIAATQAEMADLQHQRKVVSDEIRAKQLAAGRDVLAGFSDPELEKLREQLQTAQANLLDTIPPPTMTKKGGEAPRKPATFDDLEAMKARFRAQQEARLRAEGQNGYEWRDKQPESLRRDLEKVVNEDLIPEIARDIAATAYDEAPLDSLAMEQNIRQNLFSTKQPAVYERQSWENELISSLPAETKTTLKEKLQAPVRESIAQEQAINTTYELRQRELAQLQDSLSRVINQQLEEESLQETGAPQRQFTVKGGEIAAPAAYSSRPPTDVALIPLIPGSKMVLSQLQFASNSAQFKSIAYPELDRLTQLLRDNPTLNIRILGHTNSSLSHLRALELSEQRASAVVTYLINKGISIGQLQFKGVGRQQPIAEQNTPTGRMANQRIEVLILD